MCVCVGGRGEINDLRQKGERDWIRGRGEGDCPSPARQWGSDVSSSAVFWDEIPAADRVQN